MTGVRRLVLSALLLAGLATGGPAAAERMTFEFRATGVAPGDAVMALERWAGLGGVRISQRGRDNLAAVTTRDGNSAVLIQRGTGHSASLTQGGTRQGAMVIQSGRGARADLAQSRDGEMAMVVQHSWRWRR